MYICLYIWNEYASHVFSASHWQQDHALLLYFLESSIFCHIKDVWLTWMCCRGTETNIIHREKKGRLWAQEIKRCEQGSFRANRKRITVVCDFLLIRGFWRLFQALCHLPVSLSAALLETRWSLGIHRLAFVRGLTRARTRGRAQLMLLIPRAALNAARWITWSSHLVLTSADSIQSDSISRSNTETICHSFHGEIQKAAALRNFGVEVVRWTRRWAFGRTNSLPATNYWGAARAL